MQELEEDDEAEQQSPNLASPTERAYHTAPNTPDNQPTKAELMHLSAHDVEGTAGLATFSLILNIGVQKAVALVDSGSSHTFMDYNFAVSSNYTLKPTHTRKIAIAGGGHLISNATVPFLSYSIQGHKFCSNFQILPLETYDIILGIDWMYHASPVTLDLPLRQLTVNAQGTLVTLADHTKSPTNCIASEEEMNKLLSKAILGYIIQVHNLQMDANTAVQQLPIEIEHLVKNFAPVFSEPEQLPPNRECDHSITLKEGTQAPNLRPYRVPHMKKSSMEEIITKLLKSGEIQASLSPFSSPAVMVRKRDGSWRLCIDCRLLNSITIKNKFPCL